MKELWFEVYEDLWNELEREPTDIEMDRAFADVLADYPFGRK